MVSNRSLTRIAAIAGAAVLAGAGALAPAQADSSHGKAERPAHAQAKHAAAHDKQGRQQASEVDNGNARPGDRGGSSGSSAGNGLGDERGNGHTPVTVCHLLGNGSYIVLTFDENALQAHLGHGDLYPVPAGGCPAAEDAGTDTGTGTDKGTDTGTEDDAPSVPEVVLPGDATDDDIVRTPTTGGSLPAVVAGVEQLADGPAAEGDAAGTTSANRAAPALGPLAGVLPQTGAAPMGMALAGGLVLLAAGVALVARRRAQVG